MSRSSPALGYSDQRRLNHNRNKQSKRNETAIEPEAKNQICTAASGILSTPEAKATPMHEQVSTISAYVLCGLRLEHLLRRPLVG
jgi:hypothetical protein